MTVEFQQAGPCPTCRGVGARETQIFSEIGGASRAITVCLACGGSGGASSREQIEAAEAAIRTEAEKIAADVARWMYPIYEGPALRPPSRWQRAMRRIDGGWYAVREWLAVHVLRVDVSDGDW